MNENVFCLSKNVGDCYDLGLHATSGPFARTLRGATATIIPDIYFLNLTAQKWKLAAGSLPLTYSQAQRLAWTANLFLEGRNNGNSKPIACQADYSSLAAVRP